MYFFAVVTHLIALKASNQGNSKVELFSNAFELFILLLENILVVLLSFHLLI